MKNALGGVQSALILGGDSDIAIATCKRLIQDRTRTLTLAGRNLDRLDERGHELRSLSPDLDVRRMELNATAFDSHPGFVNEAFSHGDIDLVLVAFGLLGEQARDEHDASSAVDVIQTNFTGAVSLMIPIADRLRDQGHGTIVVLSTVAAERARRSNFIYGASKAGLDWFSQGLGDALHGSGVDVMIVRPGFATTKMTEDLETPPMATDPDAVAAAIIQGLRKQRDIVWVPGKLRWIMSVLRHLPRPVFRKLPV